MDIIYLVANSSDCLAEIPSDCKMVIAVDGGLNHCDRVPDLIIGDMDSVEEEVLAKHAKVPCIRYPVEKDHSDLELAIEKALSYEPDKIVVLGALGGRCDHLLANLFLLGRYENIIFENKQERVFSLGAGSHDVDCEGFEIVSLMPLEGTVEGVSTDGLKWELKEKDLSSHFQSLSNVCVGNSFKLTIEKGSLLVLLSAVD